VVPFGFGFETPGPERQPPRRPRGGGDVTDPDQPPRERREAERATSPFANPIATLFPGLE
jgi:hypothetical protein